MNDIVLILFDEAIDLFRLQFRTFEKFLEPCTINIVLNEHNPKRLKKIIESITVNSRHRIVYFTRYEILENYQCGGYLSQQLCKLLIPINSDYVVLDDKDLFIKPTSYEQLLNFYPVLYQPDNGSELVNTFNDFYYTCCKKFGKVQINEPMTPRFIKKQVVNNMLEYFKNKKKLIKWFLSHKTIPEQSIMVSEFMLYDFFNDKNDGVVGNRYSYCPKIESMIPKNFTYQSLINQIITDMANNGYQNLDLIEYLENGGVTKIPEYVHILKIHRRDYNNPENRTIVSKFIVNKFLKK
jgi:hypothetical protein